MSKRILIITYYWPPAGGAGVQRWLKFVKYLPQFNWTPIVYTPLNGEYPVLDPSLAQEVPPEAIVLRTRIREPYSWYKRFVGQKKEEKINSSFLSQSEKPALREKLARWIRGNFFIPDARKSWIKPSVRYLEDYLSENPVDVVVSTGPPHSMHLIALNIKKKLNLPWIADFRDPWTKIDFYRDLMLTRLADRKHHRLEKAVIRQADRVLTINQFMLHDFNRIVPGKCLYLPNGFDPDDLKTPKKRPDKKFIIVYAGSLPPSRNPLTLWTVLEKLTREVPEFANDLILKLIGSADISVKKALEEHHLSQVVEWISYLPHDELLEQESYASLLLLIINRTPYAEGIVTGKLYEYLLAGRPILCLGPENGEAASILKETGAGQTADHNNEEGIEHLILKFYEDFKKGHQYLPTEKINKYSRKHLTKKLVEILNRMIKNKHYES